MVVPLPARKVGLHRTRHVRRKQVKSPEGPVLGRQGSASCARKTLAPENCRSLFSASTCTGPPYDFAHKAERSFGGSSELRPASLHTSHENVVGGNSAFKTRHAKLLFTCCRARLVEWWWVADRPHRSCPSWRNRLGRRWACHTQSFQTCPLQPRVVDEPWTVQWTGERELQEHTGRPLFCPLERGRRYRS